MAYSALILTQDDNFIMKKFALIISGWLLCIGLAFAQVNINSATLEQLDGLKGIGPTKAQAIIDYRKKNGPFKSVDDLQNVPGIGPATLKDVRGDVMISGVTRVPEAAPKTEKASEKAAKAKTEAKASKAAAEKVAPEKAAEKLTAPKPATPGVAKPAAPAVPAMPAMAKPAAPAQPAMPAGK
ncbi:MAG: ComEA family DNA-binding protein [Rhodocyclaceae bacterium]|nr:ComEA family DNA-binding protein [Rhodocyclaceae bacterium]